MCATHLLLVHLSHCTLLGVVHLLQELCVRGSLAVLVCIEMFVAALAHRQERFFSYKSFKSQAVMGFGDAFVQMVLSPANLADEVQGGIQEISSGVIGATTQTLYTATETLYSGGALAMDGVGSLRRAAQGQLAGVSIKDLTGVLVGETSPGSTTSASLEAVSQEAGSGVAAGGRAGGGARKADAVTEGASLLEEAELRFESSFSAAFDS